MSLIRPYLYGWNELEPTILACVATNQNMLLIGKHGIGKSAFMHFLGNAMSQGNKDFNVHKYSMDKENMISMVGIPNVEALKQSRIDYCTHERSIFNADIALFDEITRASKENQNMVLEIMEEGTVFGKPLKRLKLRIATANDETYKGAMKLDAALLDRFAIVLPIPDAGMDQARFGSEELEEIIRLNLGKREENLDKADEELRNALKEIKATCESLWIQKDKNGETSIRDNVIEFSAKFLSQVLTNLSEINKGKNSDKFYLSLRQIGSQFPRLVMAISSYYKVVRDDPEYLKNGAWEAIKYSLSTKLCFPIDKLKVIFENLKDLLTDGDALLGKVKIGLTTGSTSKRLEILHKYSDVIRDNLQIDEIVNAIGNILQDVDVSSKNTSADKDVETVYDLHHLLVSKDFPENTVWASKMKLWHYATDANRNILTEQMGWHA